MVSTESAQVERSIVQINVSAEFVFVFEFPVEKDGELPAVVAQRYVVPKVKRHLSIEKNEDDQRGAKSQTASDLCINIDIRKVQQENSLLKLHTTKRERALGALNSTLLCISLGASHKILLWKKEPLKNVILIFQNIEKTLKDGSLFATCKKATHYPRAILLKKSYP